MKFSKIFSYKLNCQMRRVRTWSYVALFMGLTIYTLWNNPDNVMEEENPLSSSVIVFLPTDFGSIRSDKSIRHDFKTLSAVYEVHRALWENFYMRKCYHFKHVQHYDSVQRGMVA